MSATSLHSRPDKGIEQLACEVLRLPVVRVASGRSERVGGELEAFADSLDDE